MTGMDQRVNFIKERQLRLGLRTEDLISDLPVDGGAPLADEAIVRKHANEQRANLESNATQLRDLPLAMTPPGAAEGVIPQWGFSGRRVVRLNHRLRALPADLHRAVVVRMSQ